jgi:hypothetical protein
VETERRVKRSTSSAWGNVGCEGKERCLEMEGGKRKGCIQQAET